ncbi:MAG: type II toxin-antitoxin system YafQ family toxin [Akkermansiaceae bacterium]|jgi:mRNA interferase YafQ|nr:type II toxin-antitoxin system YafQ family toxin [Akkermansiaceae bacterium]MDP4645682.1 type II toxin-antitoxin system YafQ family toxin [Akkermansiaceae bacterium]MDP4719929.1 type II toxin-antitoxin system YafQ family toxin [Akkermansiaceae bacterium]MDP4778790.1 type II toxin-antitoxin system YafQ family toxin [Akkermansiaceae bacterium]MDP4847008.1 type II toxin-antitoxin system YafQ family toxin [Akkermansiaceae bacterium]
MMRVVQPSSFKKDVKKLKKRGKDLDKLKAIVDLLVAGDTLPERFADHPLSGNWSGWRDCHIEPDWILIYKVAPDVLTLGRTGTHSDLF